MRCAYFKLPGQIEMRDIPRPEPDAGDALVRVESCGICGWDTLQFREGQADWHARGHEYAGVVEEVGEGVEGLQVGDPVAGIGSLPCGECENCMRGEPKYCLRPDGAGAAAFAEFVCAPERFFMRIPELSAEQGALIEPLTVAIDMVAEADVTLGSTVLLIGAGPIGLMALAICRQMGADPIYVSHPAGSTTRANLAKQWGATTILHPDQEDIVQRMAKLEPNGIDSVLVTIKPSIGIPQATAVCAPGGTISLIGMEGAPQANIALDIDTWHFKRAKLVGSNHNPNGLLYAEGARLLRDGVIDAEELITHRFSLQQIREAFDFVTERKSEVAKVMIRTQE